MRIIVISLAAAIFICLLIATIANSLLGNGSYEIDRVSGEKIYTRHTGAINDRTIQLVAIEKVQESGLDVEIYRTAKEDILDYFSYQYPYFKRLSLKTGDGVSKGNESYSFNLESNTGNTFNVNISGGNLQNYKITIIDNNNGNTIFNYDKSQEPIVLRNIERLAAKQLPHTIDIDGHQATLLRRPYDDKYEISINSCGDNELKSKAETKIKEWLESLSYNIDNFQYEVPDYCDGEAQ